MAALNSSIYTNQTSGSSRVPIPTGGSFAGSLVTQQCTIAVPSSGNGTALNDTLGLFVLPARAILRSFSLKTDRLDSNGSPTLTLDVGYTGTPQAFVAAWAGAATALVAGAPNSVEATSAAYGYQPTVDTPIFATVHAAGSTKGAGNLVATMNYELGGTAD